MGSHESRTRPATMNPMSPPARPHIAVHSSHFTSATTTDWDDAWDSGSDSEDVRKDCLPSSFKRRTSASSTPPKPVPRSNSASSSSTLAFSYTQVNAPNPGSYPNPKSIELAAPSRNQNGWTIVRTPSDHDRTGGAPPNQSQGEHTPDADVEGDMILDELEPDFEHNDRIAPHQSTHTKQMAASVRADVDEIVNGSYLVALYHVVYLFPFQPAFRFSRPLAWH
jgi:hypothetical protein